MITPNTIIITGIILLALFTWYKFCKHRFSYRDKNTRYCYACGQKQERFMKQDFKDGYSYWKSTGRICDSNCHCHDYTGIPE